MTKSLIILSLVGMATCAQAQTLSFEEAWKLAQQNSPLIQAAANEKALAGQRKELGFYENDPVLNFQGSYTHRYRDLGEEAPASAEEVSGEQSYGLGLSFPLYDFGRTSARERQLDAQLKAAVAAEAEELAELHFNLARLYLEASAALRLEAVAAEQVQVAESRVKEQTRLYQQGLRPETDVLAARVDLGNAKITRQQAEDAALTARLRLATLLGFTGSDALTKVNPEPLHVDPDSLKKFLAQLEAGAPDKKIPAEARREHQREALQAELDRIAANHRPTLKGSLGAQGVGGVSPVRPQASAAITLAWDIPWSGIKRDEEELNALQRKTLNIESEQDALRREGQWYAARHALDAAQRSAQALIEQYKIVERQQKLVQQSYNAGRATALELSSAEAAALSVRQSLARVAQQAVAAAIDAAEAKGQASLAPLFEAVIAKNGSRKGDRG